ncbi:MAG: hypothetical protein ABR508_00680 [Candidatus Baltobacteraceae bacterium]
MVTGFDWSAFRDVALGIGVFLAGLGIFLAMTALAKSLRRLDRTLDGIDEQLAALGKPVGETLAHVGGIADTADQVIARLTGVVGSLEKVSGSLAQTVKLTQDAVSPAIVNAGAVLGGITAGVRRLVRGAASSEEN